LAILLQASVYVIVRALKDVHHSIVGTAQIYGIFILATVSLLIYRLLINPNGFVYDMTLMEAFLLFSNGVIMFFCQLLFILSCQLDKASRAAGLSFTAIVFGYIMDAIIFDYSLGLGEIFGAAVIVLCSCIALALKYKQVVK